MAKRELVDTVNALDPGDYITEDDVFASDITKDYKVQIEPGLNDDQVANVFTIFSNYAGITDSKMKTDLLYFMTQESEHFEVACASPLEQMGLSFTDWLLRQAVRKRGDIITIYGLSLLTNLKTTVLSKSSWWSTHYLTGDLLVDARNSDILLGLGQANMFAEFVNRSEKEEEVRKSRIVHFMKGTDYDSRIGPTTRARSAKTKADDKPRATTRSQSKDVPPKPKRPVEPNERTPSSSGTTPKVIGTYTIIPERNLNLLRPKRSYKFSCSVKGCNKVLTRLKDWNDHHKDKHWRIVCRCSKCPKTYLMPSSLRRHAYTHRMKTYRCSNCNKLFYFNSELKIHRKTHTKVKTHPCYFPECKAAFRFPGDLTFHVRSVHEKRVSYKCLIKGCGKSFKMKKYLKAHAVTHRKSFVCGRCHTGFNHRNQLKRHEAQCTN